MNKGLMTSCSLPVVCIAAEITIYVPIFYVLFKVDGLFG